MFVKMDRLKVGLLCVKNDPLLPLFFSELYDLDFVEYHLIWDDKNFNKNDLEIINNRIDNDIYTSVSKLEKYNQFVLSCKNLEGFGHNSLELVRYINDHNIICLLNVGTTKKLKPSVLNACNLGVMNVHPGDLPRYRGSCAVEWAIFNKEPIFLTAHKMNEEYDAGEIACKRYIQLCQGDHYKTVRTKIYLQISNMFSLLVKKIQSNQLTFDAQDNSKSRYYKPISESQSKKINSILPQYLAIFYDY